MEYNIHTTKPRLAPIQNLSLMEQASTYYTASKRAGSGAL